MNAMGAGDESGADNPGKPRPASDAAADHLRELALFEGVGARELAKLASELPVLTLRAGSAVVTEGEPARDVYVVLSGEVEVIKTKRAGGGTRVALLGPGDWFGESALVQTRPRTATVQTVAPSTILQLGPKQAEQLMGAEGYAALLRNVVRELLRRLRVADDLIARASKRMASEYVEKRRGQP